jgi:hypothetical protein
MLRRHLVAQQVLHERVVQLLGQDVGRVLLDAAEGIGAAVAADERQAFRLLPPDPAHGLEAAGLLRQVEHGQLDGRRPQVAIGRAQHRPVEAARAVLGPGRDALGLRLVLGRGCGGERQGERGGEQALGNDPAKGRSVCHPVLR